MESIAYRKERYAIIQVAEGNYVKDINDKYSFTRSCFRLVGEFEKLEVAITMRDGYDNPEWFIIIQVW